MRRRLFGKPPMDFFEMPSARSRLHSFKHCNQIEFAWKLNKEKGRDDTRTDLPRPVSITAASTSVVNRQRRDHCESIWHISQGVQALSAPWVASLHSVFASHPISNVGLVLRASVVGTGDFVTARL
jgi:hypothetical protein